MEKCLKKLFSAEKRERMREQKMNNPDKCCLQVTIIIQTEYEVTARVQKISSMINLQGFSYFVA